MVPRHERSLHSLAGRNRVMESAVQRRLEQRRNEARLARAGQRDHRKTVVEFRKMIVRFVGRIAGGDEQNFIQPELARRHPRGPKMPRVDGIESSAEKRDSQ